MIIKKISDGAKKGPKDQIIFGGPVVIEKGQENVIWSQKGPIWQPCDDVMSSVFQPSGGIHLRLTNYVRQAKLRHDICISWVRIHNIFFFDKMN